MKNSNITILFSALALVAIGGCSREHAPKAEAAPAVAPPISAAQAAAGQAAPGGKAASGTVTETMDAPGYTYVKVKTKDGELWAASSQFKVKVGDQVIVPVEMPMENFRSNSLKRTFPIIYFTSKIFFQGEVGAPSPTQ